MCYYIRVKRKKKERAMIYKEQFIQVEEYEEPIDDLMETFYKIEVDDGQNLVLTPAEMIGLKKILKDLEVKL